MCLFVCLFCVLFGLVVVLVCLCCVCSLVWLVWLLCACLFVVCFLVFALIEVDDVAFLFCYKKLCLALAFGLLVCLLLWLL